jgi:hypothetical protein
MIIWVKVIAMLQQNWCIIEKTTTDVALHFFDDHKIIFDSITYTNINKARAALIKNGFIPISKAGPIADQLDIEAIFSAKADHLQSGIYSSGDYWTEPSDEDPSDYEFLPKSITQNIIYQNTSEQRVSRPVHFEINNRAEALERWERMTEQEKQEAIANIRRKLNLDGMLDRIREKSRLARIKRSLDG